jgi:methane/ammonia monooxygenase subunit A
MKVINGIEWSDEAASLSRRFDFLVIPVVALAIMAAVHLNFILIVGDWDFWVDWKDRQYWVTITPFMLVMFPAALSYVFWERFRLPIAGTLCMVLLALAQWINRVHGFNLWSEFPYALVWPAVTICFGIIIDCVFVLTGNFLLTAILGSFTAALVFYPTNWALQAPYQLPVETMNNLVSVADYIGYAFTRTATPEYLRFIERGTLRTFGGHSAVIASFFTAFITTLHFIVWWYLGKMLTKVITVPNGLKHMMGFKKTSRAQDAADDAAEAARA